MAVDVTVSQQTYEVVVVTDLPGVVDRVYGAFVDREDAETATDVAYTRKTATVTTTMMDLVFVEPSLADF